MYCPPAPLSAPGPDAHQRTYSVFQHFRRCHALIQSIPTTAAQPSHAFPPAPPTAHERRAAENVQRALAAKVQELSAAFRKKQRVYMDSKLRDVISPSPHRWHARMRCLVTWAALDGTPHADSSIC